MAVTVELTKQARKDIDGLPAVVKVRVADAIAELASFPDVRIKALKGDRKGEYRARVGKYRIVFEVAGDVLTITCVDHRKDVY